jgi:hypothetical protein
MATQSIGYRWNQNTKTTKKNKKNPHQHHQHHRRDVRHHPRHRPKPKVQAARVRRELRIRYIKYRICGQGYFSSTWDPAWDQERAYPPQIEPIVQSKEDLYGYKILHATYDDTDEAKQFPVFSFPIRTEDSARFSMHQMVHDHHVDWHVDTCVIQWTGAAFHSTSYSSGWYKSSPLLRNWNIKHRVFRRLTKKGRKKSWRKWLRFNRTEEEREDAFQRTLLSMSTQFNCKITPRDVEVMQERAQLLLNNKDARDRADLGLHTVLFPTQPSGRLGHRGMHVFNDPHTALEYFLVKFDGKLSNHFRFEENPQWELRRVRIPKGACIAATNPYGNSWKQEGDTVAVSDFEVVGDAIQTWEDIIRETWQFKNQFWGDDFSTIADTVNDAKSQLSLLSSHHEWTAVCFSQIL